MEKTLDEKETILLVELNNGKVYLCKSILKQGDTQWHLLSEYVELRDGDYESAKKNPNLKLAYNIIRPNKGLNIFESDIVNKSNV